MFRVHNINTHDISIRNLILLFLTIVLGFASVITLGFVEIPSSIDNARQTIARVTITEDGTDNPPVEMEISSGGIFINSNILPPQTAFSGKVLGIDDLGRVIYIFTEDLVVSGAGGGMGGGDGLWTGILGGDIYNINTNNVGIGTNNAPTSGKLHIKGNNETEIYIEEIAINRAANINFKSPSTSIWGLGGDSSPDLFYIGIASGARYFVITPIGFVGIGTDVPKANLQVVGNFIAGDYSNNISGTTSSIGGGRNNIITGDRSFIGGGYGNKISGNDSAIVVGGEKNNKIINANNTFIGAGQGNIISGGQYSVVVGGTDNTIYGSSYAGFIGGGSNNHIYGSSRSFIGGGNTNNITGTSQYSVIPGGQYNTIEDTQWGIVGGGNANHIVGNSNYSVIGGGDTNNILGNSNYSVIPGGEYNTIENAQWSMVAGRNAVNTGGYDNTFVWNSSDTNFFAGRSKTFLINAPYNKDDNYGGVGINIANPSYALDVSGDINSNAQIRTDELTARKKIKLNNSTVDTGSSCDPGNIIYKSGGFYGCNGGFVRTQLN